MARLLGKGGLISSATSLDSTPSSTSKKKPAPAPAPEVATVSVTVRFWADREVSIAQHQKTLARVPGVSAVTIDDEAKTATATYTGDHKGLSDFGAVLNGQGAVVDPARIAGRLSATSATLQKLADSLKQMRGVRWSMVSADAVEFWVNAAELDLEGLAGLGRFTFSSYELLEATLSGPDGNGKGGDLRKALLETRGVLAAEVSGSTLRVLALKGRVGMEAVRKLAAPLEIEVAPLKR
ncbi:MAG: hypothetical protein HY293_11510 [Planctomycetes bacterium]|nr:hypothetical protein [Planctomycetota bacterium]